MFLEFRASSRMERALSSVFAFDAALRHPLTASMQAVRGSSVKIAEGAILRL
jgi:hypothetical protein